MLCSSSEKCLQLGSHVELHAVQSFGFSLFLVLTITEWLSAFVLADSQTAIVSQTLRT